MICFINKSPCSRFVSVRSDPVCQLLYLTVRDPFIHSLTVCRTACGGHCVQLIRFLLKVSDEISLWCHTAYLLYWSQRFMEHASCSAVCMAGFLDLGKSTTWHMSNIFKFYLVWMRQYLVNTLGVQLTILFFSHKICTILDKKNKITAF